MIECYAHRRIQGVAVSWGGSFDRLRARLKFCVGWRKNHEFEPTNTDLNKVVKEPTNVNPVVWHQSGSPQWWRARWRNGTDVCLHCCIATLFHWNNMPQHQLLEKSLNGTKSENEVLGDAFLLGKDFANTKGQNYGKFSCRWEVVDEWGTWSESTPCRTHSWSPSITLSSKSRPVSWKGLDFHQYQEKTVLVEENRASSLVTHVEPICQNIMIEILNCFL